MNMGDFVKLTLLGGLLAVGVVGCEQSAEMGAPLDEARLREGIQRLASDEFEGRAPFSHGEEMTVPYLIDEFSAAGLEPANGDSYEQMVPMVSLTVQGQPTMTLASAGGSAELAFGTEFVAWTKRVVETTSLSESEMVFVGYGIVAPEYDWNDYAGIDVSGKTVVILVNDPGFATQDDAVFNGNAMTYYGRWTYKYEEAARQGAAGAIIVHETAPAAYPWEVVQGSWTGPQLGLVSADDNMSRVAVEGWITIDRALQLFEMSGHDYRALADRAKDPGFAPVSLGATASVSLTNTIERSESRNVAALLPGTDRPDEYVVVMAHWDHLGKTTDPIEDQIFNGAADNATGTAGILEMARVMAASDDRPARSVLFLAVTAEEQGLLGSAYYGTNPLFPTSQTVAAVNIDVLNTNGSTHDITVIGLGNSELDDYLEAAASDAGRVLRADPEPEKGSFYRSDHFSFAKVGIPSLYADGGIDNVEHGTEWALAQMADYTENRYHSPADEYDPDWDLSGAMDDLQLLYRVVMDLANTDAWPNWREGNEFRALRDADRSGSN